ncbi:IS3 family transposase [[Anoxybacillus] calidus]
MAQEKYNLTINHKRVYRFMKELGIQANIRRKRKDFGKKEAYVVSDNHLNREFLAKKTNEKWVKDIMYLSMEYDDMYQPLKIYITMRLPLIKSVIERMSSSASTPFS